MIRKSPLILTVAACLIALAPACPAQTRVAYVDIDRVTAQSKTIKNAMDLVAKRLKNVQEEIAAKQKLLDSIHEEIRKGEGVLAESEMKKKHEQAQSLQNDVDELQLQARRKMQELDQTFYAPTLKRIVYAIQDVAHDKNLDLVVRGEAVLYGTKSSDITDDVIKKLNSVDFTSATLGDQDDDKKSSSKSESDSDTRREKTDSDSKKSEAPSSSADSSTSSHNDESLETKAAKDIQEKIDVLTPRSRENATEPPLRPVDRQKD